MMHFSSSSKLVTTLAVFLAAAGCASQRTSVGAPSSTMSKSSSRLPVPNAKDAEATTASDPATPQPVAFTGREIARSRQGRPIVVREFDGPVIAGQSPKNILLFAGIHGSEQTTVFAAARLLEILERDASTIVPTGHHLVVIPVANPDGYAAGTRQNSARIDLNRNFPANNFNGSSRNSKYAPGYKPLSEPESRALYDLVLALKPVRILTLHSIKPPNHGNNYDGPARPLAELMASKNHYAVLPTIGYPTPGSFGSWAGIDLTIPTITLEFPSTAKGPAAWAANREAILAFIRGR